MNSRKLILIFIAVFLVILGVLWLKGYFKASSEQVNEQTNLFPLVTLTPYPTWKPRPGAQKPTVTYEKFPYKTADKTRKVEIVGCQVDNSAWGMSYPKKVVEVPNVSAIASETMKAFLNEAATSGWGAFPTKNEIKFYAQQNNKKYPNEQVILKKLTIDNLGNARVYFSQEVETYGGGSARVACIHDSTELTLKQFSSIKNVILCIENVCSDQKGSTLFQP
jgi:hypothetical protein